MPEGSPWPSLTVLFPLPSERARAGLPMAARAADDRRTGAAFAAAAQRLSSAGRRRGNSDHQDDPSQEVPHEHALLPLEEAAQVLGLGVPVSNFPLLSGLPLFSMFRPLVVCFPVSAARCCHQVSSKHGRSVVGRGGNGSRCRRR